MVDSSLESRIVSVLDRRDEILFAYLYGSFARNTADDKSDMDIGVYLKEGEHGVFYPERLARELEEVLDREVDVRILNKRNITFLHQVLKDGKLQFCRDEDKRVEFETKVYDMYLDIKYYLDMYNEIRKERVLT